MDQPGVLDHGTWLTRTEPFPHVLVPKVFRTDFASAVDRAARDLIYDSNALRHFGWYDAYACGFAHMTSGPLQVFASRGWHDLIAEVMDVRATGHVHGGIHHHPAGTDDGFIHNDLNPVYFDRDAGEADVVLPAPERVSYTNGDTLSAEAQPHEVVRCTAIIYYLANPAWHAGDGGETGLYRRMDDDVGRPASRIPPVNNSMILFNCAPNSYHSFVQNRVSERNSVVMWLHASVPDMAAKYGRDRFTRFKRAAV